jgi:cell division transport system permease protein
MIILLSRIIKYGFQNLWRNGLVSSATIAIMFLTLSLSVSLLIFGAGANISLNSIQEKIDVSVYFNLDADEAQILMIKESLEELEEIKSVEYISRDLALEKFKERHKDDEEILQSLEELGENPLFASLNIKAKDADDYSDIALFLEGDEIPQDIIDKVNYSENRIIIERLSNIVKTIKGGGILLIIILSIIAFMVTFNTIRLAIFSNRESIEIMRLVGAPSSLIRGPYIIEGIVYGFIATIITTIVFIPLVYLISPHIEILIPEFSMLSYFWSNFLLIFGFQILIGVALGVISSLIAIRKYLRI